MTFMIGVMAIFLISSVYLFLRLKKYLNLVTNNNTIVKYIYIAIWIIELCAIVCGGYSGNLFGKAFSWYFVFWLYFLMCFIVADIVLIFIKKFSKVITYTVAIVVAMVTIIYGVGNAYISDIKEYDVHIDKTMQHLKVVSISDTHFGSNIGVKTAKEMVEKINMQNPDIVLYAGDVFDGDYEWVSQPDEIAAILTDIKSKYGVYAIWGNHDVYGGNTPEMYDFLKKSNIELLEDEYKLIDNSFYIVGRLDSGKDGEDGTKSIYDIVQGIDNRKPIICMDHRPKDLDLEKDAGIDLLISGHTHDGQTFPGNLFIGNFWENPYGLLKKDSMTSIVTSGVGLWGPPIRVGTDSEIVVININ